MHFLSFIATRRYSLIYIQILILLLIVLSLSLSVCHADSTATSPSSPSPPSRSSSQSPSVITPPKPTMIKKQTTQSSSKEYEQQQQQQQQQQPIKKKRRSYVTVITTDDEVNKSLVMLSTLLATTRTEKTAQESLTKDKNDEDDEPIDYICLILPKEFRGDDDIETNYSIWKQYNLGVSHSNIQKIVWSGCQVRPITHPIYNPNYGGTIEKDDNINNNDRLPSESVSWSSINYNLLWIWSLEQYYETMIYIQYDHIVLSNINHLFDIPPSNFMTNMDRIDKSNGKGCDCDCDKYGCEEDGDHKQRHRHQPFMAAAPHYIIPNHFDSGVMIVQPDLTLFQDMVHMIKEGNIGGGDIFITGDEDEGMKDDSTGANASTIIIQTVNDFLNEMIYPNWYSMSPKHRLEPIYNAPYELTFHENIWLSYRKEIHIFHYTDYNKPEDVISNPSKSKVHQVKVSKYAAPLIYLWSLIMYFVTSPLVSLEDETRYVLQEVFDITKDSKDVVAYIARMKRGGTRRRIEVKEKDGYNHDRDDKSRRDEL